MSTKNRLVPLALILLAIAVLVFVPTGSECVVTIGGSEECRSISIAGGETPEGALILYLAAMLISGVLFAVVDRQQVRIACMGVTGALAMLGVASAGLLFLPAVLGGAFALSRSQAAPLVSPKSF